MGLGCMGLSIAYEPGATDEATGIEVIRTAIDLGVTLFDTSDAYGPALNEQLLGKAVARDRDRLVIATKAGCAPDLESLEPSPTAVLSGSSNAATSR